MGSDTSPDVLFDSVLKAAQNSDPSVSFVVLATPEVIDRISACKVQGIELYSAPDVIQMSDEPLTAVRRKKGSSLVAGIRLLKKRRIDAFVSAGNTGALLAASTLSLPLLPNVKRPALLAILPTARGTVKGSVAILDIGGNVACKAHHLVQFAHMGAAYQRCIQNLALPRVGLLNIGVESQKGRQEVRQAYQTLQELKSDLKMHFVGNIEAREVLQGNVDVLVTDGFTGNVLLKSIEGASAFILQSLSEKVQGQGKLPLLLQELYSDFNTEEYPGAILCGVEGIVVKCHGNASPRAFFNGIKGAVTLVERKLVSGLKD